MPVNIYKRTTKTKGTQWEVIVSIGGRMVRQQWSLGRFRTVRAIIRNIAPKHRLAVALAEATDLRISEICALRWSNIDWTDARLGIQQSKTRAGRRLVPVPSNCSPT